MTCPCLLEHLRFLEWILAGDERDDQEGALRAHQRKKERMRPLMRKLGREKAIYHRNQVTPEKVWTEKSDGGDVILLTKFRSGEGSPKYLTSTLQDGCIFLFGLNRSAKKATESKVGWIARFTSGALVTFTKWRFGQDSVVTWESHTEGYVYGCVETDVYMAASKKTCPVPPVGHFLVKEVSCQDEATARLGNVSKNIYAYSRSTKWSGVTEHDVE
ncbi:hypothetical protein BT69DRAFT_1298748 [Atractiella rhizophila]|nr:hypothetical protein BT69DRAFT_1298748 [Atractiella rhizophila]